MYKWNVKTRIWRKLSNNETLELVTDLLWILSARAREAKICNKQVEEKHTVWTRMFDHTSPTTVFFWEININFIPINLEFY